MIRTHNEYLIYIVDKLKARYQQLQADLNEERELQVNLIQAIEMLRPNDWMIAQLKDKLLAQQAGSSLLTAPHQRRLQEILNGKRHVRIQLSCTTMCCINSYQAMVCIC